MNFDKDASFFAVYDGHGGPEIALYCSKLLPAFLKTTDAYKRGDFEQALKDAFLGFDSKLLGPDVIEELKVLAGDKYGYGEEDGDEDSDEDLAELKQEGGMPIEEVLTKYRNIMKNPLARIKDEEPGGSAGGSGSSFKPHSPCLRGKRQALTSTENGNGEEQKPSASNGEEEAVSSSSVAAKAEAEGTAAAASSSSSAAEEDAKPTASKPMESPDSSSTDANKVGNSEAVAGESSSSSKGPNDVSSSSSNSVVEAGAASSAGSSANGESPSSTNVERAAKRVALALSDATPEDSDDSDEDDKDMTYDENDSTDDEEVNIETHHRLR